MAPNGKLKTMCWRICRTLGAGAACWALVSGQTSAGPASPSTSEAAKLNDGSRIGRSAVPKAPEYQELYEYDARALSLTNATFPYEVQQHRAHVVMLAEQHIITRDEVHTILLGLSVIEKQAETDPSLRAYLPYEKALIKEIGHDAGKMHTGRSRDDIFATVTRMFYRDQINRVIEGLIALREALVTKAAANLDTVMVVYTHRKEAQPVTLGHYLMAISESVGKSIERYEQLYARMNLNPLGAAASAGSSWPLNRGRTTELLGFDGMVIDTVEGVASWEHIAEFAADDAIYLSTLGRLASEIQLWSTDEYAVVDLDPSFAGTSSIMPQKKNPDSLERSRQIAAAAVGPLVSIVTSLNSIEYQFSLVRVALDPRAIDAMMAATHAMTGVVRTMQPDKARMLKYATENYSTMTDLADTLVREGNIAFRDAHEIVAHVVIAALDRHATADQITLGMIQQAAQAELGHPITLSARALKEALDPVRSVASRDGVGGPAPSSVRRMIETTIVDIAGENVRLAERRGHLAGAKEMLDIAVVSYERN